MTSALDDPQRYGWRICRAPYAALDGEGARRFGGRWNSPGVPCVYLADSPALAALAVRVHLDLPAALIPEDFVLVQVALEALPTAIVAAMPADSRTVGDDWLRDCSTPLLSVPSALVPVSRNLLLNPAHPAAPSAREVARAPFRFDARLWRSG